MATKRNYFFFLVLLIAFITLACSNHISKSSDDTVQEDDDTDVIEIVSDIDDVVDEAVDFSVEQDDDTLDEDVIQVQITIVPTNQTKCYDNSAVIPCPVSGDDFYGQDAHYPDAERRFSVQGVLLEKEIVDSMTGLIWQQTLPTHYDECLYDGNEYGALCRSDSAVLYCDNLNYAEFTEWRLPTIEELSTLYDYGDSDSAIDETFFLGGVEEAFWSETEFSGDAGYDWSADFSDGSIRFKLNISTCKVRCVRGNALPKSIFSISTRDGDGVVIDATTNLMWQQSLERPWKNWEDSLAYCESLSYAGLIDWRLPNIKELQTLLNYTNSSFIDEALFPDMPKDSFWPSSTTCPQATDAVFMIDLNYFVESRCVSKTRLSSAVRCVR